MVRLDRFLGISRHIGLPSALPRLEWHEDGRDSVRMSTRTGDHTPTGAFFASRPGIEAGELARPVAVESFAPTTAALLGVALPGVDGTTIRAICG